MSPTTTMVAAVGLTCSTPMGSAINVSFNNGGGRCRSYRQHPLRGTAIDVLLHVVAVASIFWQHLLGGHYESSQKKFGSLRC
jgi:hypothetical protein